MDADKTLKILIEMGFIGKDQAEEAKAKLEALGQTTTHLNDATLEHSKVTEEATEKTESFTHKKRELREATESLTRSYPALGDAISAVFNPAALAIFGIVSATEIWKSRVETLARALGGIELPPLGDHIKEAQDLSVAYDGMAKAVAGANREFNSSSEVFERQDKAIRSELSATKQLIEAQKEKAIADLDVSRAGGQIGAAEYEAKKAIIEQGANDKTVQAEINARNQDLIAKKNEANQATRDAKSLSNKAEAIKLPENDAVAEAQAKEYDDIADAQRKAAKDARALAERVRKVQNTLDTGSVQEIAANIPEHFKVESQVGAFSTDAQANEAANIQDTAARNAESEAERAERQAAAIRKKVEERKNLRKQAEDAAAKATTLNRGIEGEDDPNNVGSVAWQNIQDAASLRSRDQSSGEIRFAGDITGIQSDLKAHVGSQQEALRIQNDIVQALRDATSIIKEMGKSGNEVGQMRQELAQLKSDLFSRINNFDALSGV